ncbi:MAG: hypothetical protein ABI763_05070 [Bacteroidota bacterium]
MLNRLPQDNFLLGLFTGIASLFLSWLGLRAIRMALVDYYGNPYFFPSPRIELITILINLILFRVIIVNLKKEKTGRGILFSTVVSSMIFFFLFYKLNFRLP